MTGTEQRVGKLAAGDLGVLAPFRAHGGWLLRQDDAGDYWLRVPAADEEKFRKLPLFGRWIDPGDGRLVREGRRVPDALLPDHGWQAIAVRLPVTPPQRGAPGMPPVPIGFQLEASAEDLPAGAVLCRWEDFSAWAAIAFADRLGPLRFARSDDGRAFVCGDPLPPIPGQGFHALGRLWLPCGRRLPDHLWPELLIELLGLGANRVALIHADGSHEEMDEENLIPATRAAIRASDGATMEDHAS